MSTLRIRRTEWTLYPFRKKGRDWNPGPETQRLWLMPPVTAAVLAILLTGCEPTIKVEAPKEPITINLNIKLDADVRLRVEEKAKEDVETKSIF